MRTEIYDAALVERFFNDENRLALMEHVRDARSPRELATHVNVLLDSLQLSHNRLYTDADIEFYLFHSMFRTRDIATPRLYHVGAQTAMFAGEFVLRALWDGYPAARAGLKRDDVLLQADGETFHPLDSFRSGRAVTLTVRRERKTFQVRVEPVHEGVNASLLQAMKNSLRHLTLDDFDVGYVHLWSGTCPEILHEFRRIVVEDFGTADAILLDLRDGWGGAWYEYLDPFFEDRSDFYSATVSRRGERRVAEPEAIERHEWFSGPLVVLVNEGTRSGKEALAYQFKKSKRAVLVGTRTAGAFTGGSAFFRGSFALYVPYNGPVLLDGQPLEGRGVMPDIQVEDSLDGSSQADPQLQRATQVVRSILSTRE